MKVKSLQILNFFTNKNMTNVRKSEKLNFGKNRGTVHFSVSKKKINN